jgi:hypothetical protein
LVELNHSQILIIDLSLIFSDLWGCPPGYFMLEMNCYKQFRTAKAFADAEVICQNNGGFLAIPVTLLQVN